MDGLLVSLSWCWLFKLFLLVVCRLVLVALFRFNACCVFVSLICLFVLGLLAVVVWWVVIACFTGWLLIGGLWRVCYLRMSCGSEGVWLRLVGLLGDSCMCASYCAVCFAVGEIGVCVGLID